MAKYHKESSFVTKAAGMAALGGLITLGLTKGAPLIGEASERVLGSRLGRTVLNELAGLVNHGIQGSSQLAEELFSAEGNVIIHGAETVETSIRSSLIQNKRLNFIIGNLRNFTENLDVFDSPEFTDTLKQTLGRLGSAEDPSRIPPGFQAFQGLSELNSISKKAGVSFNFESLSVQHKHLMDWVREAGYLTISKNEVERVLTNTDNQEQILATIRDARESHAAKARELRRRFLPDTSTKSHRRDIKFRDLFSTADPLANPHFNEEIHQKITKQIQIDLRMPEDKAQEFLYQHINRAQEAIASLFGGDRSNSTSAQALWEDFLNSSTGFSVGSRGEVINWHRPGWVASELLDTTLKNVQIPLVPYHFNVPLSSLRIAPKIKELSRSLGLVSENPEIRRILEKSWGTSLRAGSTSLASVGDQILTISQNKIQRIQGRFAVLSTRDSSVLRRVAEARSTKPNSLIENAWSFKPSSGQSKFQKFLYSVMPNIAIAHPDGEGIKVTARHKSFAPFVHYLYGKGEVDPRRIHPVMLGEMIEKTLPSHYKTPEDYYYAISALVKEAGQSPVDSAVALRRWASAGRGALPAFGNKTSGQSGTSVLNMLYQYADNPDRLLHELFRNLSDHGGKSLLEMPSEIKRSFSPQLYQALMTVTKGYRGLLATAKGEGSLGHYIKYSIQGESGLSSMSERLQRGLLSQMMSDLGTSQYGGYESLGRSVLHVHGLLEDGVSFSDILKTTVDTPVHKFLTDLRDTYAINSSDKLDAIVQRLVENRKSGLEIHQGRLGELSSLLLKKNHLFGLTDNNLVKAKMLNQIRVSLESWALPVEARNLHLRTMMLDDGNTASEWVTDAIKRRFHLLRQFHPQDLGANPIFDPRSYVVPLNTDLDPAMVIMDPKGTLISQIRRGFNAGYFLKTQLNPSQEHGMISLYQHMLTLIPQSVAENVGLGLNIADQSTPLRTTFGWWAKRALPVYLGIEMYKNLNDNAHTVGLPGVDDIGANIVANSNRLLAGIKDSLGLTVLEKTLARSFPGLDQYIHPRSRDEYEDYLFYGDEDVREGRGWFTGARTPLTGGRIGYVRPNFYRRWRSHWTESENVDISNSEYSYLPSVLHPFSPIKRFFNPNWFVRKHLSDRPYAAGGNTGTPDINGRYLTTDAIEGSTRGVVGSGLPAGIYTAWHQDLIMGQTSQSMYGKSPGLGGSSESVRFSLHKEADLSMIHPLSNTRDFLTHSLDNIRSQAGLVGAFLRKLPGFPSEEGWRRQNWRSAISSNRLLFGGEYGELSGSIGEFFRRIINRGYTNPNDYNDLPNNQPSWLPAKFRRGDPYTRVPGGEFNLPGEAYEKLNPWISPLKVRGSVLGGSVSEIVHKWLYPAEPLGDESSQDIVEYGSLAHKLIQRQLSLRGVLVGAEVPIYDDQNNISGTIDAIIRGQSGAEIWDIKTQGDSHWGEVPEKYIDQVTAYMAITGIHTGGLAFSNRDNPSQVRFYRFGFDPERWERILGRIEQARSIVENMVHQGVISPFETYDLLTRIDVLSKVAPDSQEFRELVEYADKSGGFGGFEHQRYQQALSRAKRLRQTYHLYPFRDPETEVHRMRLTGVTDDGLLVTNHGVFKLAGVKWDAQAFGNADPEEVLARFGVGLGDFLPFTMIKGQFDPEIMNDITPRVVVGNLNKRLVGSVFAGEDIEDDHPLSRKVIDHQGSISRLWEHLVHMDSMLTNKFLRVRTAVEQLERGEIYGTDDFRWSHIFSSLITPTIISTASKNPVTAALKGAALGAIFLRTKNARKVGAIVGAAVGFSLSTARALSELITGHKWKPRRVRKQEEFDEYWDTLEYVKYSTMAEAAKRRAKKEEGVDINALESGERSSTPLGPWGMLALHSERRAAQTMYGFNQYQGSLRDALQVIPRRHRQLAQSVIETGSIKEKRRFYDLISSSERRVLGRFLGVDETSLPTKQHLTQYFSKHYLPEASWGGWAENIDLDDLRERSAQKENMKVERPGRNRVQRAIAYSTGVPIPKVKSRTPARIRATLERLMSKGNFSKIGVKYETRPAEENVINIKFDVYHDQTDSLQRETERSLHRSY